MPEKSRSKKSIDRDNMRHQYLHPMAKQSRVCGLEDLRQAILRRDPLGTGISNRWALDLLSRLLKWEPAERITMIEGEVKMLLCLIWINVERLLRQTYIILQFKNMPELTLRLIITY